MKKAVSCAQCGTKMRAGIKFCSKCGYTLRDAEAEALAAAAQEEEAAANFLTEEEIAAMRSAEQETPAVPEIPEVPASPAVQRVALAGEKAVAKRNEAAAVALAKKRARSDLKVARVEANSADRRGVAANGARLDAALLDKVSAKAEAKATKKRSASSEKLISIQIGEDKKAAKRLATAERKNLRTTIDINTQDAARLARGEKRDLAVRAFGSKVEDLRQAGEHAMQKKQEKETLRAERAEIADRDLALRDENKANRARAKALRAAERKSQKYRQDEENGVVREKTAENRLRERRIASDKAIFKQHAVAEEKLQALQQSSDRKAQKRRQADIHRAAAKQAAVNARELKRLGNIEYRAAVSGLSDEAAESRRLANAAALDMQRRRQEEKLTKKNDAADVKLLRQTGAADDRLQSLKISDAKKNAKRVALERRKATRALLREEGKFSQRGNDEIRKTAEEKAFDNRLYAKQAAADRKTRKRRQSDVKRIAAKQASIRERETKRLGSIEYKAAATGLIGEAAEARRQANAAELDMQRRRQEKKIIKKGDAAEKKLLRQTSAADDRLQSLRINDAKKTAKHLAKDRYKATKALLREDAKISGRENDEIRKSVQEKAFDNRLYAKQAAAERKTRKRRQSDVQRVAAKRAAVNARETKRLGSVEYKAAKTLTDEAVEARRQADATAIDMQRRRAEEKLAAKEVENEKRLVSRRAGDKKKAARIKVNQRTKETRNLSRAELRALRATQVEEAKATRRQADEIKLNTAKKVHEDKLYAKKLAADRRLIKSSAADADKIQKEDIRTDQRRQLVQKMEDSRNSRVRTDVTKRDLRAQKNQDQLYRHQKNSSEDVFKREHKLELKQLRENTARDKRVIAQKEKEQKKSLALASRSEKEALKRAKKISRISGVPVSLVPALANDGGPSALLATNASGAPALHEPDALLSTDFKTKREQFEAFNLRKKREKKALRYVEIPVRNDAKYFSTIYQNGEVMVAKRTVTVARIQAILAIVLMLVALVGSLLPIYTFQASELGGSFYDKVLDGTYIAPKVDGEQTPETDVPNVDGEQTPETDAPKVEGEQTPETDAPVVDGEQTPETDAPLVEGPVLSIETVLADKQSDFSNPIQYLTGLASILGRIEVTEILAVFTEGMATGDLIPQLGRIAFFLLLSLAVLLTPIVILLNLLIAIIRVIFSIGSRSVRVTRVMKNLRASFVFLGAYLLPILFIAKVPEDNHPGQMLPGFKMEIGLILILASFAGAVLLNFILNLIKKYERSDRRYATAVMFSGLIRLVLLLAALYMIGSTGMLTVNAFAAEGIMGTVAPILVALTVLLAFFCARSVSTLGFEVLGYTRGHNVNHWPMVITGILAAAFAFLPGLAMFKASFANPDAAYMTTNALLALVIFLVIGFVTLVMNLVKKMIVKRGCLIDPILDALDEGYPLK